LLGRVGIFVFAANLPDSKKVGGLADGRLEAEFGLLGPKSALERAPLDGRDDPREVEVSGKARK